MYRFPVLRDCQRRRHTTSMALRIRSDPLNGKGSGPAAHHHMPNTDGNNFI